MALKAGTFVNHSIALEWGAGRVVAVTPTMAIIEFNDGISRKIASSHFHTLKPAEASSFVPQTGTEQVKPGKKRTAKKSPPKKD